MLFYKKQLILNISFLLFTLFLKKQIFLISNNKFSSYSYFKKSNFSKGFKFNEVCEKPHIGDLLLSYNNHIFLDKFNLSKKIWLLYDSNKSPICGFSQTSLNLNPLEKFDFLNLSQLKYLKLILSKYTKFIYEYQKLEFKSNESNFNLTNCFNISDYQKNGIKLPIRHRRFTILRSPHIDKKSRNSLNWSIINVLYHLFTI